MPSPEETPSMNKVDLEISSMFSVVSGPIKGRDEQWGYDYHSSLAQPLGIMARVLQMRHGLSKAQVFERLAAASELAIVVQEHVEPNVPEDPNLIYN